MAGTGNRRFGSLGMPGLGGVAELVLLSTQPEAQVQELPAAGCGNGHRAHTGRETGYLWISAHSRPAYPGRHLDQSQDGVAYSSAERMAFLHAEPFGEDPTAARGTGERAGAQPEMGHRHHGDQGLEREKGRLAVIIDCADRMVLAWRFARRMPSEELQEMVREAVFGRFGAEKEKAQNIEFLSDNGPEYACRKLRGLLQDFGMVVCRTPRCSPESNGLVEAFFGSFKRDYVYQGELESLEAVAQQLPEWIKDYNEVAPHSALGMKSPVPFYADWMLKISTTPVQI